MGAPSEQRAAGATEQRAPAGAPRPGAVLASLWRELVLPAGVALALVLLAVALIEGPPAGDFLYAIF